MVWRERRLDRVFTAAIPVLKHGRSTVDGSARATFLSLIHEVRTIALYTGERFWSEFAINVPANVPPFWREHAQRDFAILSLARSFVRHTCNTIIFFLKRCSLTRLYLNTESWFRVEQRGSVQNNSKRNKRNNFLISRWLEKIRRNWKDCQGLIQRNRSSLPTNHSRN